MADQPIDPAIQAHRPQPSQLTQPVHTESNVVRDIAQQLRQATVIDNQVTRVVQFTEDEVKAMADALEAQAAPKAPEVKR